MNELKIHKKGGAEEYRTGTGVPVPPSEPVEDDAPVIDPSKVAVVMDHVIYRATHESGHYAFIAAREYTDATAYADRLFEGCDIYANYPECGPITVGDVNFMSADELDALRFHDEDCDMIHTLRDACYKAIIDEIHREREFRLPRRKALHIGDNFEYGP